MFKAFLGPVTPLLSIRVHNFHGFSARFTKRNDESDYIFWLQLILVKRRPHINLLSMNLSRQQILFSLLAAFCWIFKMSFEIHLILPDIIITQDHPLK